MIKNKKAAFGLFVVLCLIFWNIMDYLYSTFITKSAFQFAAGSDLILPLVVSIVVGYFAFLRERKN